MELPIFYQENISAGQLTELNEDVARHCLQVLRMKQGYLLQLTDGKGNLYTAKIIHAAKKSAQVTIEHTAYNTKSDTNICIGISLLKNTSRLEWFIEKATEIGVSEIIPLICHRTEKQKFRKDRMQQIIISAMLQSRRTWLPVLRNATNLVEVMQEEYKGSKLIAHCEPGLKKSLQALLSQEDKHVTNYQMLIGPEGDFTTEEIDKSLMHNYEAVTLGNNRLRTETAGIVSAVFLQQFTSRENE